MRSLLLSLAILAATALRAVAGDLPDIIDPDSPPPKKSEPGDNVPWRKLEKQNSFSDRRCGPVLSDIESHMNYDYARGPGRGNPHYYRTGGSDPVTWGHETLHGIGGHLSTKFFEPGPDGWGKKEWFYCLNGNCVGITKIPGVRIGDVQRHLPRSLIGRMTAFYLKGNGTGILYLLDEWNAYVGGAEVWHDQRQHNPSFNRREDAIFGVREFVPYILAVCLSVEHGNPGYLSNKETGEPFREFIAYNLRRSSKVIGGPCVPDSPDAQRMKSLVVKWYGQDFCEKYVFGSKRSQESPLPEPIPAPVRVTPPPDQDTPPPPFRHPLQRVPVLLPKDCNSSSG